MVCSGGAELDVNPEHWRFSTNSTTVLDCPLPSACLGGYYPKNEYPVKWETGYKGYLWSEWDIVDGVKYVKASGIQWEKCDIGLINILKFVGVIFASFIFLTIMIIILIRKKKRKPDFNIVENAYKLFSIDIDKIVIDVEDKLFKFQMIIDNITKAVHLFSYCSILWKFF